MTKKEMPADFWQVLMNNQPVVQSAGISSNVIYYTTSAEISYPTQDYLYSNYNYNYNYYQTSQMPRLGTVLANIGSLIESNIGSLIESPEDIAAREERRAERKAAEMRAEKLLFTILKPAQVRQYSDDGYFDADINGRIYRLHRRSRSMNVELIEAGKPQIKFCAQPNNAHEVPIPDVVLSQLLMLQTNEAEFLRIANRQVIQ